MFLLKGNLDYLDFTQNIKRKAFFIYKLIFIESISYIDYQKRILVVYYAQEEYSTGIK